MIHLNYKKDKWSIIWDALYYNFIYKHQNILKKNYAITNQVKNWNNKSNTDKQELLDIAKNYLNYLFIFLNLNCLYYISLNFFKLLNHLCLNCISLNFYYLKFLFYFYLFLIFLNLIFYRLNFIIIAMNNLY